MYQQKADLISILVLANLITVNGVRPDRTLCLDVLGDDAPFQIHVPLGSLHPVARRAIEQQLTAASVKCSIGEHLESKRRK